MLSGPPLCLIAIVGADGVAYIETIVTFSVATSRDAAVPNQVTSSSAAIAGVGRNPTSSRDEVSLAQLHANGQLLVINVVVGVQARHPDSRDTGPGSLAS